MPTLKLSPNVSLGLSKFKETPLIQNHLFINYYLGRECKPARVFDLCANED